MTRLEIFRLYSSLRKTMKTVNTQGRYQSRKLLNLMLILGVLGMSVVGCAQTSQTTDENQASPTITPGSNPSTPTPTTSPTSSSPTTSPTSPSPTTSSTSPSPEAELPKPNEKGEYQRTSHKYWQVTDSDPTGLNCRMGKSSIEQIQDPGSNITLDIGNWSVVGTFKQGQTFEIDLGPAGFGIVNDTQKQPWFYVTKSSDASAPSKCFIRANSSFIKPVQPK